MILQQIRRMLGMASGAIRDWMYRIVYGLLALAVFASVFVAVQPAHAAGIRLVYHRGYSVQRSWLCYGWPNGAFHCTQHWKRSGNGFISYNPRWVPSNRHPNVVATASVKKTNATGGSSLPLRTRPAMWARTGYAAYAVWWGSVKGYTIGQCTAGAAFLSRDIPPGLGNAKDWTRNARARGMIVSSVPTVGSTVVWQPGVQGASWLGHVGHVVGVYANGWFLAETENDGTWAGGGWNRVDYRYGHVGAGVSFIR